MGGQLFFLLFFFLSLFDHKYFECFHFFIYVFLTNKKGLSKQTPTCQGSKEAFGLKDPFFL